MKSSQISKFDRPRNIFSAALLNVFVDIEMRLPFTPIKPIDLISGGARERPACNGETLIMAANAAL